MKMSIFKKAELLKDKVIEDGSTSYKAFFTFEGLENPPLITLALEKGKYTYLESCSCTQHSIFGGLPQVNMKNLCSYVLAVYKALPIKTKVCFYDKLRFTK